MRIQIVILSCVLSIQLNAQYSYFNIWVEEASDQWAIGSANIFVVDSTYLSIGATATFGTTNLCVREFDYEGVLATDVDYEIDYSIFYYSPDQVVFDSENNLILLTQINGGSSSRSFLSWWNQDFELISIEINGETNIDTAVIKYSGLRKLEYDTIALAGVYGFNTDTDDYGDDFEVVLWKRSLSGETVWKKTMFYQEAKSMFVCDFNVTPQGEYLIVLVSGTGINKNHVIIKADSEGNYMDHYEWGGEYNEYKCRMLPLDNGNYVVFYDDVTGGDWYATEIDLHLMEFNPSTMLPVPDTDIIYENEYTDQAMPSFQIDDFLKTPDGGYAVLMNFRENDPIQYQPFILKLDSNYEYEWMKTYAPDSPWIQGALFDFEVTHDGGFIATGDFVYPPEPQSYFRHWVIKLDACGDVVYMDCPYVDIDEHSLDPSQGLFSVFPNPASSSVFISSTQEFESITIRDITGRIVYKEQMSNHTLNKSLYVEEFGVAGLYLVEVDFGGGRVSAQKLEVE